MDNYGLKITGADELETILPRRCDVIKPAMIVLLLWRQN